MNLGGSSINLISNVLYNLVLAGLWFTGSTFVCFRNSNLLIEIFLAEELVKLGIADGVRGNTWKLEYYPYFYFPMLNFDCFFSMHILCACINAYFVKRMGKRSFHGNWWPFNWWNCWLISNILLSLYFMSYFLWEEKSS